MPCSTPPSSFPCSDESVLLEALEQVERQDAFDVYEDPWPASSPQQASLQDQQLAQEERPACETCPALEPAHSSRPTSLMTSRLPHASPPTNAGRRLAGGDTTYLETDAYRAIPFGDFGTYMKNKRLKLQVQEASLLEDEPAGLESDALRGCSIYITGRTDPPYKELRRMIVLHGGQVLTYLDHKRACTHIVASTLPPKKVAEFRAYKVVSPAWVLESCRMRQRANWTQFRLGGTHTTPWTTVFDAKRANEPSSTANDVCDTVPADAMTPHTVATATSPAATSKNAAGLSHPDEPASCCSLFPTTTNQRAAELLRSEAWRAKNTAASRDFLAGFYANSRLHHLSTWKNSLQDLVASAVSESGTPPRGRSTDLPRTIVHIDFDSFFVSVSLRAKPAWRDKPVAVCHATLAGTDGSSSTSDVASCNYVARRYGVKNGMSLRQARHLCPSILPVPYAFDAYYQVSLQFYAVLLHVADVLQVVSVDEALLDATDLLRALCEAQASERFAWPTSDAILSRLEAQFRLHLARHAGVQPAHALGEALRDVIRLETQCEASVGIGANILQARLATRQAKPCGVYVLDRVEEHMQMLDVRDIWGVGFSLRERLLAWLGTTCIGEICQRTDEAHMIQQFGPKHGRALWQKFHGHDTHVLQATRERQSVGAHVNWGVRLHDDTEVRRFLQDVCAEVMRRASHMHVSAATHVQLQVMQRADEAGESPKFLGHGLCRTFHRSIRRRVYDRSSLYAAAWPLLQKLQIPAVDVRGIALSVSGLERGSMRSSWPWESREKHRPASEAGLSESKSTSDFESRQHQPSPAHEDQALLTTDAASTAERHVDVQRSAEPRSTPCTAHGACASPKTPVALPTPSPSQFQVPSSSQLDSSVMADLPTQMREYIERVLEQRRPPASPILDATPRQASSSTPTTPSKRRRSLTKQSSSTPVTPTKHRSPTKHSSSTPATPSRQSRLPMYFSPRREKQREVDLASLGIDQDVFDALPPEIQSDVLAERTAYQALRPRHQAPVQGRQTVAAHRRQAAECALMHEARIRVDAGASEHTDPYVHAALRLGLHLDADKVDVVGERVGPYELAPLHPRASLVECPPSAVASAHGFHVHQSLDRMRAQITQWYETCAHDAPRRGDLQRLCAVLKRCVDAYALDKVRGVLLWWRALLRVRRAEDAWLAACQDTVDALQAYVTHVHGGPMDLSDDLCL